MDKAPRDMTFAKLDVLVMPNGEVMCLGNVVGTVRELGKQLSPYMNAVTGENINEN